MDNEDWFTEKNFQYTLSENKITIRKYIGSSSIVRVPAEINSYPVICLGKESFSNHLSLKKISIPSSITQIENGALWGCPKLASIDVNPENSSFCSIDGILFDKNTNTLILHPPQKHIKKTGYIVPDTVDTISSQAFAFCSDLEHITLPKNIKHIGDYVFQETPLNKIELPAGLQTLGIYPFINCTNLITIRISSQCKAVINSDAIFEGEKADLTYWEYDKNGYLIALEGYPITSQFPLSEKFFVKKEEKLFVDKQGLSYSIKSNSFVSITGYKYKYPAGKGKHMKTSHKKFNSKVILIPSILDGLPVTQIDKSAFFCREKLEGIVLPESILSINETAFMYCTSLTNIIIPKNTTNISMGAFRHCSSLTNVFFEGNSLRCISPYTFDGCTNLTFVSLPASITNICEGAFKNCSHIQSILTGADLAHIGKNAFEGCLNLTNMVICSKLISIDESFETCSSLENFIVSTDNPFFTEENGVLLSKDRETLIRYPRSKRNHNYYADISESDLDKKKDKEIPLLSCYSIPETVTHIAANAFSRSYGLTNIILNKNLKQIGPFSFYMCTNLQEIHLPDSISVISPSSFSRCTHLHTVEIGSGVKYIHSNAFAGCREISRMFFHGDALENSKSYVDDWHRITIYHTVDSKGWNSLEWRDKSKRLWIIENGIPPLPIPEKKKEYNR